jgi:DNA-binding MarR family transcriptional regulator
MENALKSTPLTSEVLICLRKIIQSIDLHSRFLVREVGLTGPQLIILQTVGQFGELTVGEIAKSISLSQATVTGILERLEVRGYIIRQRDRIDRRRVIVSITPAGDALIAQSPPLMQQDFIDQFTRLQEWEQTMILAGLQRLVFLLDAKKIPAAPILASGPISDGSGPDSVPNAK